MKNKIEDILECFFQEFIQKVNVREKEELIDQYLTEFVLTNILEINITKRLESENANNSIEALKINIILKELLKITSLKRDIKNEYEIIEENNIKKVLEYAIQQNIKGYDEKIIKFIDYINDDEFIYYYLTSKMIVYLTRLKYENTEGKKKLLNVVDLIKIHLKNIYVKNNKKRATKSYFNYVMGRYYYEEANLKKSSTDSEKTIDIYELAIEHYKKAENENLDFPDLYNAIGDTYVKKANFLSDPERCYQVAQDYYLKAIKYNVQFSFPYNGLGNIYRSKGYYYTAIMLYKMSNFLNSKFSYPLNYLGDCYRLLGDYEKAINYYTESIKVNDLVSFPYYGMGRAYYELGKLQETEYNFLEAEKYFKKAIEKDEKFFHVYKEYGRLLVKDAHNVERIKQAIKKYEKAIEYIHSKNDYWKNLIIEYKTNAEKLQKILENSEDNFKEIIRKTIVEKIDINQFINKKKFGEFLKEEKNYKYENSQIIDDLAKILNNYEEESVYNNFDKITTEIIESNGECEFDLEIMKRWNSFTPLVVNNSKGGGYFIRYNGRGIVVDPGYNFIENFKSLGHKFHEIDCVFISHSHDDHTAEVERIINVLYKYNKSLKEEICARLAKYYNVSRITIQEQYKDKIKQEYNIKRKKITFYITKVVNHKYQELFKICSGKHSKFFTISYEEDQGNFDYIVMNCEDDKCKLHKEIMNIQKIHDDNERYKRYGKYKRKFIKYNKEHCYNIKYKDNNKFPRDFDKNFTGLIVHKLLAKHEDMVQDSFYENSLGFLFQYEINNSNKVSLIYTGDTGWDWNINDSYDNLNKTILDNTYKILVAHIGGFKNEEIDIKLGNYKSYYKNHLGRAGLFDINKLLNPDICVISEFGEEFQGLRVKLAKIYQEFFQNAIVFLPGDIGLTIDMVNKKIKVITDVDHRSKKITYSYVDPQYVKYEEIEEMGKIVYYNKDITASDCVKGLILNYVTE